ncbi:hypothetical protein [Clostridium kluyveri]|uniref:Uncharacterized protein n=1 Tax=Clostridium kluyveri TaxID=1534 RepID=A0A1L5FBZ0_CLOKL|nr:hypothetical protein [Clostridium kluyveri]APM40493.1 hypothetical protein BS101_18045 [Clostridium kluyveri]APM40559.1 hypothetical protein BS101_18430 [Clostridium kluyveri]UZQ49841.1 hypothetical protein OP486_18125 [Clostridium kluyveri]
MKILKYIFLWVISFIAFMYGSSILDVIFNNDSDSSTILITLYALGATIIICTYLIINSIKEK